jgi:3-oxoadipate enol-lactonase
VATTSIAEVLRIPQLPPVEAGEVSRVLVPGRGKMRVRSVRLSDRVDSPPILLLHGWSATADVNFGTVIGPISESFDVIAPDLRGHGGGIKGRDPFTIESCADDMAGLIETLGIGPVVTLGYSLGGPVALVLARRRPDLVSGLVLCATAARLGRSAAGRIALGAIGTLGLAGQMAIAQATRRTRFSREIIRRLPTPLGHDLTQVAEVGIELARFDARPWLSEVNKPAAVVVTLRDHAVPPIDQEMMAKALPMASVFCVDGDHDVCLSPNPIYESTVCAAIYDVVSRASEETRTQRSTLG